MSEKQQMVPGRRERAGGKPWSRVNDEGILIPQLGDRVTYNSERNDGVKSPAVVLRTQATTIPGLVEAWMDAGAKATLSGANPPPEGLDVELDSNLTVDLLVHGLGGDYRRFSVPFNLDAEPGCWNWPEDEGAWRQG